VANSPGLAQLRRRAGARADRLRHGLDQLGELPTRWGESWAEPISDWIGQLEALQSEIDEPVEVFVTLLGGTGAGKSTLINALLDARLLPVGNINATTAAICEVGFRSAGLRVRAEYVPPESLLQEVTEFADRVRSERANSSPEPGSTIRRPADPVVDKLVALCGEEMSDQFLSSLAVDQLRLPDTIRDALQRRSDEWSFDAVEAGQPTLDVLLSSKGQWWPVIARVIVDGPFERLKCGARLVDVPGLNDPNSAREQVTTHYLQSSQFVWVVFNMKRALTKELTEALSERDLFRTLVIEGREGALSLVGTAADDIDPDADISQLGLDANSSNLEIAEARSRASRDGVRKQLHSLAQSLASESSLTGSDQHRRLLTTVEQLSISTVSARDYLYLRNLQRLAGGPLFPDTQSTGIPSLGSHLEMVVEANVGAGRLRSLTARFDRIEAEIRSRITSFSASLTLGEIDQQEVAAAADRAARFLEVELKKVIDTLSERLSTTTQAFDAHFAARTAGIQAVAGQLQAGWATMPWNTLQACCRRNGRFVGTSGSWNLGAEVAGVVLDATSLIWADFFGRELLGCLHEAAQAAHSAINAYKRVLTGEIARLHGRDPGSISTGDPASDDIEELLIRILSQAQPQSEARIHDSQIELSRLVADSVSAGMAEGFSAAAVESGDGMRDRMARTLGHQAQVVLGHTVPQVQLNLRGHLTILQQDLVQAFRDGLLGDGVAVAKRHGDELSRGLERSRTEGMQEMSRILEQMAPAA
jgi:hypothetical protein